MTSPNWLDRKACSPEHARLFFPGGSMYEPGRSGKIGNDYGPALALCAQCPVVAECRADAIAHGDIVGGFTTHGQVVGGCAPRHKAAVGAKEPVMLPCSLEGCARVFTKRPKGANMYCSVECASEGRRVSQVELRSSRRKVS